MNNAKVQDKRDRRISEDKRDERLVILLTEAEMNELDAVARSDPRSRSAIARAGIFSEIRKIKQNNPGLRRG